MQNRDVLGGNGKTESRLSFSGCFAGYRVMTRCRDGQIALVSLAWGRQKAVQLAEQFRDRVIAHRADLSDHGGQGRGGVASIYVEAWSGTAYAGHWEHCGPRRGGFCHVFRCPTSGREGVVHAALPKSGEAIACVLLAQRTRKGGWRASLVNRRLAGPVTNSADMPALVQPGELVTLRVGAVSSDGTHIQFTWAPNLASQ
jgi:hypothetical protein